MHLDGRSRSVFAIPTILDFLPKPGSSTPKLTTICSTFTVATGQCWTHSKGFLGNDKTTSSLIFQLTSMWTFCFTETYFTMSHTISNLSSTSICSFFKALTLPKFAHQHHSMPEGDHELHTRGRRHAYCFPELPTLDYDASGSPSDTQHCTMITAAPPQTASSLWISTSTTSSSTAATKRLNWLTTLQYFFYPKLNPFNKLTVQS